MYCVQWLDWVRPMLLHRLTWICVRRCGRSHVRTVHLFAVRGWSVCGHVRNGFLLSDDYVGRHILADSVNARLDGVVRLVSATDPSGRVHALHSVPRMGRHIHRGGAGLCGHMGLDPPLPDGRRFHLQEVHINVCTMVKPVLWVHCWWLLDVYPQCKTIFSSDQTLLASVIRLSFASDSNEANPSLLFSCNVFTVVSPVP